MATGSVLNNNVNTDLIKSKWPDYLMQWRTGLWVSIREKESNVWKFVTFYGAAISLIIGLGQKLATSVDLVVDISVGAALVGLVTFWGLAIVLDSNSWMARNLKLVGNIEKIFIPKSEFANLLPQEYSSPFYRCYRPYTVHFSLMVTLGFIAYLNFVVHFTTTGNDWRSQLLGIITLLYLFGFFAIQWLDASTRSEYLEFFEAAKGKPLDVAWEIMPSKLLSLKLDAEAKFDRWSSLGAAGVLVTYAIKEWRLTGVRGLWYAIIIIAVVDLLYLVISYRVRTQLKTIAQQIKSPEDINEKEFLTLWPFGNFSLDQSQKNFSRMVSFIRWLFPVLGLIFVLVLS